MESDNAGGDAGGGAIAPEPDAHPYAQPGAQAGARAHPLRRKTLWLGLASLLSLLAGAGLAAAPLIAGAPPAGWIGIAFGLSGGALTLLAFATPRWGGTLGVTLMGAALLIGAVVAAFGKLEAVAPAVVFAGGALVAAAAGAFLAAVGSIGARGWPMLILACVALLGAGGAMVALQPPPAPWTGFAAAGAALVALGLCLTGLALAARRPVA
jgi:uncharacterized membrane protein HdeD (DUF308 family)